MTTTGPNSAGTGASDNGNGGTAAWTNPDRITVSDNSRSQASVAAAATTEWLKATNFGFSIPTGDTIDGIQAGIEKRSGTASAIQDVDVKLVKGGTVQGANKAEAAAWPTVDTYSEYGGAADLWDLSFTPADINATNFGVVISALGLLLAQATVDHIRITITHTAVSGMSRGIIRQQSRQVPIAHLRI